MDIQANASIGSIADALAKVGGQIQWSERELGRDQAIVLEDVEVDDEDAFEHLPSRWFDDDQEPASLDASMLGDFLAALVTGDRSTALAIASRLFTTAAELAVVEQHVPVVRRAA